MAAPKGNKYYKKADPDKVGRPPIHTDPKEVERLVDEYLDSLGPVYNDENEIIGYKYPTLTGLTLALGFCDKSTLYDYAKKEEFSNPIKKGLLHIEKHYEESLNSKASTGAIFALKNFKWKDKTEVEQTTTISFTVGDDDD